MDKALQTGETQIYDADDAGNEIVVGEKDGTIDDAKDMQRMGKDQQLRVSFQSTEVHDAEGGFFGKQTLKPPLTAKLWVSLNHGVCDDFDEYLGKSTRVSCNILELSCALEYEKYDSLILVTVPLDSPWPMVVRPVSYTCTLLVQLACLRTSFRWPKWPVWLPQLVDSTSKGALIDFRRDAETLTYPAGFLNSLQPERKNSSPTSSDGFVFLVGKLVLHPAFSLPALKYKV